MSRANTAKVLLVLLLSSFVGARLRGQSAVPIGREFQVNSYTTFDQRRPAVSIDAAGDFVVAWSGLGAGGDANDIALQRYDFAGVAMASEFVVSAFPANGERYPSMASHDDGRFVVGWSSNDRDGSDEGVFARRFDAAGEAQAVEFQVNQYTVDFQTIPAVAVDGLGQFVVTWMSNGQDGDAGGIFARRFTSTGAALAPEFQVNTYTTGQQVAPVAAADSDGDFVIAWDSPDQDGSAHGIFARRFDSTGTPLASEFQVNSFTINEQFLPSVATDAAGDFVVAWYGYNQDEDGSGIFARRFDSTGEALASEFQVNSYTQGNQLYAAVASDAFGRFVIVWESGHDGDARGIFARLFDTAGVAPAPELQVNSYTAGAQRHPSVAIDEASRFVITWESAAQDGAATGVFAQHFALLAVLDVDADQKVGPLTDGLLVLRFLFGFTGAPLTMGALGVDCTRCAPEAIVSYIAALGNVLDVDGNGTLGPLSDGLLILRYLFGFTDEALVTGATGGGCTRCTADPLEAHIKLLAV